MSRTVADSIHPFEAAVKAKREPGEVTDLAGNQLVDGNSRADVGGAFLQTDPGEKSAIAAGVIAGAVRPGFGVLVIQAAEDLEVLPLLFQRLQRGAEFMILSFFLRPPGGLNRTVRKADESGAERRAGCRGGQFTGRLDFAGQQPKRT